MTKYLKILQLFIFVFYCISCEGRVTPNSSLELRDTINASSLGFKKGHILELKSDIDLNNKICIIPDSVTIKSKGGVIKNGVLVGNETKIIYNKAVFDNVSISGTWNVPVINTTLFRNLNYENSLKNVLALTTSKFKNKVVIEPGKYIVAANKGSESCLFVNSNTNLLLNGTLILKPNKLKNYDILHIEGDNITISGKGSIIGDKHSHLGNDGEWGMGIRIHQSNNVSISGLTIKDCWGDCIYIGGDSRNIIIKKCFLSNGRRQGISITKADSVFVRNTNIQEVGGTDPEYAIDIEPNKGDSVGLVVLEKLRISNCIGGIVSTTWHGLSGRKIGVLMINDCDIVSTKGKIPMRITRCSHVKINGCIINHAKKLPGIYAEDLGNVCIVNNTLKEKLPLYPSVKDRIVASSKKTEFEPVEIVRCVNVIKTGNKLTKNKQIQ